MDLWNKHSTLDDSSKENHIGSNLAGELIWTETYIGNYLQDGSVHHAFRKFTGKGMSCNPFFNLYQFFRNNK